MSNENDAGAPPATAAEATARLAELGSDPAWRDSFLAGSAEKGREFRELTALVSSGKPDEKIEAAMIGLTPPGGMSDYDLTQMTETVAHLRGSGIEDAVIKSALKGDPISREEFRLAEAWRDAHMRDTGWARKLFDGDVEAKRQLGLVSIILSSPIKDAA